MLVDEPTEGLAPMLVQHLTEILRWINQTGTTILLVEQTLEVALASDRLYVMDQARIESVHAPDQLADDPTIQQRFLEVSGANARKAPMTTTIRTPMTGRSAGV